MSIAAPQDGLAWITGASTGIGAALVAQLVGEGWTVVATARGAEKLDALAAAHPGRVIAAAGDITDAPGMAALVEKVEAETGQVIALAVLNAGAWQEMGAGDFDLAAFHHQIGVNLGGTAACLAPLMERMIARNSGQIAIVASVAGYRGLPRGGAYGASKAALIALAESLKFDLDKAGVTMNIINPGFVRTPMTAVNEFPMPFLLETDDAARRIARGLKRSAFEITFPWQLAWPLKLLQLLPARLFFWALSKAGQ
jgi:NAD(P)-dependent dehydrogenase (short-subunit alcohol dehydrogenase family)